MTILSDIDFPKRWEIESDSRKSAMGAIYGNVFCGVAEITQSMGIIYLAPYTHSQERPEWKPSSTGNGNTEYLYTTAKIGGVPLARNFKKVKYIIMKTTSQVTNNLQVG